MDAADGHAWTHRATNWSRLSASSTPVCPYLVYDAHDGYVLCVGYGPLGFDPVNATWTFKGGIWTKLHLASGPAPYGWRFALTYDSTDSYVLLFGGILQAGQVPSNATWIFTNGGWSRLHSTVSPFPRWDAIMTDDPSDGGVLLFGGTTLRSGVAAPTNDTWEFKAGQWTEAPTTVSPPTTDPVEYGPYVYDPAVGAVILVGSPCGTHDYFACNLSQVWRFHAGTWLRPAPSSSNASAFFGSNLVYDPTLSAAIAVGEIPFRGQTIGPSLQPSLVIWSYGSPGTWTHVDGPIALPLASQTVPLAYDPTQRAVLAIGPSCEFPQCSPSGSLWAFTNGSWHLLNASLPFSEMGQDFVYDAADGYDVLYGGTDVWQYHGGKWTQVIQQPGAAWPAQRYRPLMTYDARDGAVVMFGGGGSGYSVFNDTWEFRAGNWTELHPPVSPPASLGSWGGLVYDTGAASVLYFGGAGVNATWLFASGSWTNVASFGIAPPGRNGFTMVDDPPDNGVLLFGGYCPFRYCITIYGDTWLFSGNHWIDVTRFSADSPGNRTGSNAVFDASIDAVLLEGGALGSSSNMNDSWEWETIGPVPDVRSFVAQPNVTRVGELVRLTVSASEGGQALRYAYTSLPPGCGSADSPVLNCTPSGPGLFQIRANVTDPAGHSVIAVTSLQVLPGPYLPQFRWLASTPGLITLGGLGAAVLLASAFVWRWRRKRVKPKV